MNTLTVVVAGAWTLDLLWVDGGRISVLVSRNSVPFVVVELIDFLCLYLLLQHTTMPATSSAVAASTNSPPTDAVGAATSMRYSARLSDNSWVSLKSSGSDSELVDVPTEFEVVVASTDPGPAIDKRITIIL